ncbi:hypothetical protein [Tsukamurella pulmonis]|uniref:hypothetical protein n=1 Tax=Tsukamurella pulmonis TaxID=47312 RepID=UPI000E097A6D|nr:hypothetical protein [Tsukamurella pulmonis]RDH13565.1 hypothetical protein DVB88_01785 [Tsukamurella pulmonis]
MSDDTKKPEDSGGAEAGVAALVAAVMTALAEYGLVTNYGWWHILWTPLVFVGCMLIAGVLFSGLSSN